MTRSSIAFGLLMLVASQLACADDQVAGPSDAELVLAYTQDEGNSCNIQLLTLGRQHRTLPQSCGFDVAWSPDGRRLAFVRSGGEAAPPNLWIMNADGSNAAIVPGAQGLESPDWSPDGQQLAGALQSGFELAVVHADGTGMHGLPGSSGITNLERPSWSPDGSSLLFARNDTILSADVVSGDAHVLGVPGLHGISEPRWSPDGTHIAFLAPLVQLTAIYTMDADGSNITPLLAAGLDRFAWSPDSRELVYSASNGATIDVYIAATDGSSPPLNLTNNPAGSVSLHPDWARARLP